MLPSWPFTWKVCPPSGLGFHSWGVAWALSCGKEEPPNSLLLMSSRFIMSRTLSKDQNSLTLPLESVCLLYFLGLWLGRYSGLSFSRPSHYRLKHFPFPCSLWILQVFSLLPSSQSLHLQLVYDGIPKGDLQQRELQLSVLSEQGFWENVLLGEVHIRLRELDLAQEKTGWFALGSRSHETS